MKRPANACAAGARSPGARPARDQSGSGWPALRRASPARLARGAVAGLLASLTMVLGVTRGAVLLGAASVWLSAAPRCAQASPSEGGREYWQTRYRELKSLVANLRSELEQKRAEYSRRRHDRRLRGETRTQLLEQIADLEKRLAAAERELAEFPETARKAGALPGWFRDL